jgi:hypothetical protein
MLRVLALLTVTGCDTSPDVVDDNDTGAPGHPEPVVECPNPDGGDCELPPFIILEWRLDCDGTRGELEAAASRELGVERLFYVVDTRHSKDHDFRISGTDLTTGVLRGEGTLAAAIRFSNPDQGDGDTLFECRDVVTGTEDFSTTMGLYATDLDGNDADCVIWGHAATALANGLIDFQGDVAPPSQFGPDCYVQTDYEE